MDSVTFPLRFHDNVFNRLGSCCLDDVGRIVSDGNQNCCEFFKLCDKLDSYLFSYKGNNYSVFFFSLLLPLFILLNQDIRHFALTSLPGRVGEFGTRTKKPLPIKKKLRDVFYRAFFSGGRGASGNFNLHFPHTPSTLS